MRSKPTTKKVRVVALRMEETLFERIFKEAHRASLARGKNVSVSEIIRNHLLYSLSQESRQ